MVVDSGYLARYSIGGTPAGTAPVLGGARRHLDELASGCGIDPDGLAATVAEFNRHAARRAATRTSTAATAPQDRYLGDATRSRTPASRRSSRAPYHAIPIRPGTLGTCGGLVTDDDGRVLDRRGGRSRACTPPATSRPPCSPTPTPAAVPRWAPPSPGLRRRPRDRRPATHSTREE